MLFRSLRDVEEDRKSGKKTLAVRLGPGVLQQMASGFVILAMILSLCGHYYETGWFFLLSVPWFVVGVTCIRGVKSSPPGRHYNRFLAGAALQLVLFAVLFTVAAAI